MVPGNLNDLSSFSSFLPLSLAGVVTWHTHTTVNICTFQMNFMLRLSYQTPISNLAKAKTLADKDSVLFLAGTRTSITFALTRLSNHQNPCKSVERKRSHHTCWPQFSLSGIAAKSPLENHKSGVILIAIKQFFWSLSGRCWLGTTHTFH